MAASAARGAARCPGPVPEAVAPSATAVGAYPGLSTSGTAPGPCQLCQRCPPLRSNHPRSPALDFASDNLPPEFCTSECRAAPHSLHIILQLIHSENEHSAQHVVMLPSTLQNFIYCNPTRRCVALAQCCSMSTDIQQCNWGLIALHSTARCSRWLGSGCLQTGQ